MKKGKKDNHQELDDNAAMNSDQPENQDPTMEGEVLEVNAEQVDSLADDVNGMKKELEAAKARAQEATDQYLRLLAEFDNFRKRSRREYDQLLEYASEKVLSAILPVLDDFDRTLTAMEKTDNLSSIKEGITMVTSKLQRVLEKEGLNLIEAKDAPFDSSLHEAIHSVEVPAEKKGKVLEQVEKGYRLKDKVIRYAKVIVGE
jgi:molecular chaperone GrpE